MRKHAFVKSGGARDKFIFRDLLCSLHRGQPDFPGAYHGPVSATIAARFSMAYVQGLFLGAD